MSENIVHEFLTMVDMPADAKMNTLGLNVQDQRTITLVPENNASSTDEKLISKFTNSYNDKGTTKEKDIPKDVAAEAAASTAHKVKTNLPNLRQKSEKMGLVYPSGSENIKGLEIFYEDFMPPPLLKNKNKNTQNILSETTTVSLIDTTKVKQDVKATVKQEDSTITHENVNTHNPTKHENVLDETTTDVTNPTEFPKEHDKTDSTADMTIKIPPKNVNDNQNKKTFSQNLLDSTRQFFLGGQITPESFLTQNKTTSKINIDEPVEIHNASDEEEINHNPLISELPHIPMNSKPGIRISKLYVNNDLMEEDINKNMSNQFNSGLLKASYITGKTARTNKDVIPDNEKQHENKNIDSVKLATSLRFEPTTLTVINKVTRENKDILDMEEYPMNDEPVPDTIDINAITQIVDKIKMIVFSELAALENNKTIVKDEKIEDEPEYPELPDDLVREKVNSLIDRIRSIIAEEQSQMTVQDEIDNKRKSRNAPSSLLYPDNPFLAPLFSLMNKLTKYDTLYFINSENPFLVQDKITGKISIRTDKFVANLKSENQTDLNIDKHVTNTENKIDFNQNEKEILMYLLTFVKNNKEDDEPKFMLDLRFPRKDNETVSKISKISFSLRNGTITDNIINPKPVDSSLIGFKYFINADNPFLIQDIATGEISPRTNNINIKDFNGTTVNNTEFNIAPSTLLVDELIEKELKEILTRINQDNKTHALELNDFINTTKKEEKPFNIDLRFLFKDEEEFLHSNISSLIDNNRKFVNYTVSAENPFLIQDEITGEISSRTKNLHSNVYNGTKDPFLESGVEYRDPMRLNRKIITKRAVKIDGNVLQYDPIGFLDSFDTTLLPHPKDTPMSNFNSLSDKDKLSLIDILPLEYIKLVPELKNFYENYISKINDDVIEELPSPFTFDDIKSAIEGNFDTILENGNIQEVNGSDDSLLYKIEGSEEFKILPNKNNLKLNIFGNAFDLTQDSMKYQPVITNRNTTKEINKRSDAMENFVSKIEKTTTPPVLYVNPINEDVPQEINNINTETRSKFNAAINQQSSDTELDSKPESRNPYLNPTVNEEKEKLQQYLVWQKYRNDDTQENSEWIHIGKKIDSNTENLFDDRVKDILDLFRNRPINVRNDLRLASRFGTTEDFDEEDEIDFNTSNDDFTSKETNKRLNLNKEKEKNFIDVKNQESDLENFVRSISTFSNYWQKYNMNFGNRRIKRHAEESGDGNVINHANSFGQRTTDIKNGRRNLIRNNSNLPESQPISQVASKNDETVQQPTVDSRQKLFQKDEEEKRIIEQLFRDNLVDAFKRAASIKRNDEFQPDRMQVRTRKIEEVSTIEPVDDNYEGDIVKITPKPIEIQHLRNEIVKEQPREEIHNPRIPARGKSRGRSTSIHQVVRVAIPEDDSYSIGLSSQSKPVDNQIRYVEEVEVKPQETLVEQKRVKERRHPTKVIIQTETPVQVYNEEIQYVKRPTSDRRRQHIEAIKKTRKPMPVSTEQTREVPQRVIPNPTMPQQIQQQRIQPSEKPTPTNVQPIKIEPQPIEPHRRNPERITVATEVPRHATQISNHQTEEIEFKPLEEQPEEIKTLHRLYLESLNKAKAEEPQKRRDPTRGALIHSRNSPTRKVPQRTVDNNSQPILREHNHNVPPTSEPSRATIRLEEFKPLEEQPEEIQNLHRLYLEALRKSGKRKQESIGNTPRENTVRHKPSVIPHSIETIQTEPEEQTIAHARFTSTHETIQTEPEEQTIPQARFTSTHVKLGLKDTQDNEEFRRKIEMEIQNSFGDNKVHLSSLVAAYAQSKSIEKGGPSPISDEFNNQPGSVPLARRARIMPTRNPKTRGSVTFKLEDLEKELHRTRRSTDAVLEGDIKVQTEKRFVRPSRGYSRFPGRKTVIAYEDKMAHEATITAKPTHKIFNRNRGKIVFRKEDYSNEFANILTTTMKPAETEIADIPFESMKTDSMEQEVISKKLEEPSTVADIQEEPEYMLAKKPSRNRHRRRRLRGRTTTTTTSSPTTTTEIPTTMFTSEPELSTRTPRLKFRRYRLRKYEEPLENDDNVNTNYELRNAH